MGLRIHMRVIKEGSLCTQDVQEKYEIQTEF